ncbi:MAG: hypothetical protein OEV21_00610 [Thermoplasmata archaeon]|nr:hypothetical protein [Thermoplasmata archaeon]
MKSKESSKGSGEKPTRILIDGRILLVAIAVVVICIGGACIRLSPLTTSDYPYILDGLGEARYANHIMITGSLQPEPGSSYSETHIIHTPVFDAFLAMASEITGIDTISMIQLLVPAWGVLLLLGAFVLIGKLSGSSRASIITIMGLASYGPFLLITQASWKECVGIALLPLILISFYHRQDIRMRFLSTLLILLIPFVHHLVALIAILSVSFMTASEGLLAGREKRFRSSNLLDVIVIVLAVDETAMYYSLVRFDRLEYLTPENGLYLFLGFAVLVGLGVYYIAGRCLSINGSKAMTGIASSGLVILVGLNVLSPIGTIRGSALWIISIPLIACFPLIIGGIFGISTWAKTAGRSKILFFSYLAAPFTLIMYALLRAGDLLSLDIITRTVDFLDIGVFAGLGIFIALLTKDKLNLRRISIVIIVSALMIASMPMALNSEKYLGTRNTIYEFEVAGIDWAATNFSDKNIQTDTHYSYVRYLFDYPDNPTLVKRFLGDVSFESDALMIASYRWVTVGVKDLPYGWIKLNAQAFDQKLNQSNVLYMGGPAEVAIVIFTPPEL